MSGGRGAGRAGPGGSRDRDTLPRLAPPPRRVPRSLRVRLVLGSPFARFAWPFFGIALSAAVVAAAGADVGSWVRLQDPARTTGAVVACVATALREGGSRGSHVQPSDRVYANRFQFDAGDRTYTAVSYARGACLAPGTRVAVEYAAQDPRVARIAGMRHGKVPAYAFVAVTLFTAVALAVVAAATALGRRTLRALRRGELVLGTLVGSEATRLSVNGRTVMRLRFEVEHRGAVREVVVRTAAPALGEGGARTPLLVDPARPAAATAWDTLPGEVALDASGALRPVPYAASLLALGPAALGVAVALWYALS